VGDGFGLTGFGNGLTGIGLVSDVVPLKMYAAPTTTKSTAAIISIHLKYEDDDCRELTEEFIREDEPFSFLSKSSKSNSLA